MTNSRASVYSGRDVIVMNKPGAQTLLGTRYLAMAPPRGNVLLFATSITNFPVFTASPAAGMAE